ncbi:TIGR03089 family protein [Cellulomonas fimi]|uniref:TIGR03089 family protein n=1 Tax=Cellulomonas fimi TaxID=1708 RepID=UPI00235A189E|nr:TIGR03089 family protein [Cellulomonas fimi]
MPGATIADLLTLVTRNPGRPRLTWYGADGERVELSGAVLENWVNKTTNLLVEEFDAAPGTRVALDLPPHWRTLVWAMATWRCGACVVLDGDEHDVLATHRPAPETRGDVVAVALAALARRFDGPLPGGAVDAASAVMTYGDVVGWAPPVDRAAPALDVAGMQVPHDALVAPAAVGARTLVDAGAADVATFLRHALGVLAADGSLVVLDAATAGRLRADPEALGRLVTSERVEVDTGVAPRA